MHKLIWREDELMAEHDYARPHEVEGALLHGGFDAGGNYISPRTKYRWAAIEAWQKQLAEQGVELLDASRDLLARENYPNAAQQLLLLDKGLGQSFWDGLTRTGIIEARGNMLAQYAPPDLQAVIIEDISATATGHLGKGLLRAHGIDEGGDPNHPNGAGAHDHMWFAVRDLVFGENAYPMPDMPPRIDRPKDGAFFPELDEAYDFLFTLLLDVLMIEIRAAAYFDFCVQVIAAPASFPARREEKKLAAEMVERIRTDENIHVAYLQTVISELRSFTFKGRNGDITGSALFDAVWRDMVEWHGKTQFDLARKQMQAHLYAEIDDRLGDQAKPFIAEFEAASAPITRAAQ